MKNLQELVRPNVWQMNPYSSARNEYKGIADVWLDANESPFGKWNRYPDPSQERLKELIVKDTSLKTAQLFLGNGSDEIIDLAFRIFCEPHKDRALCFGPTYGMYSIGAQLNAIELIELPLNESFDLDEDSIAQALAVERLKLIVLCSPNNPTGNTLNERLLERLLQQFEGIVLLDEAYIHFSEKPSWTNRLLEFPNLLVIQTLSKAWGLAALRIGLAFGDASLISLFNKVKPPYNISSPSQALAIEALENKQALLSQCDLLCSERKRLQKVLQTLPWIKQVFPSEANFLLLQTLDAEALYQHLIKRGIVVRKRGQQVPNSLRISVGSPIENNMLISALRAFNPNKE